MISIRFEKSEWSLNTCVWALEETEDFLRDEGDLTG